MDIRDRLASVRCFLLDLDGTLYLGDRMLDGSLEFLEKLRQTGRTCLFLTNNSSRSAAFYREKLRRLGVPRDCIRVLTSGQAAARYVKDRFPGKKGFLLANALVTREMRELGVETDAERPDYVLVAFDTELDYGKLTRLCDHVRAGLPYIVTHPDLNCPIEGGFVPDIGATIAFVKASTGREPDVVIGKPEGGMILEAARQMQVTKAHLAMVGDRLYTDIAAGIRSGVLSILVLSGETDRGMLASSPIRPDLVFPGLRDMIPYL